MGLSLILHARIEKHADLPLPVAPQGTVRLLVLLLKRRGRPGNETLDLERAEIVLSVRVVVALGVRGLWNCTGAVRGKMEPSISC